MSYIKPKNILAGKLRQYRITNRELAKLLCVSEATIQNWLKGRTSPGIDYWVDIREILNSRGADETLESIYY